MVDVAGDIEARPTGGHSSAPETASGYTPFLHRDNNHTPPTGYVGSRSFARRWWWVLRSSFPSSTSAAVGVGEMHPQEFGVRHQRQRRRRTGMTVTDGGSEMTPLTRGIMPTNVGDTTQSGAVGEEERIESQTYDMLIGIHVAALLGLAIVFMFLCIKFASFRRHLPPLESWALLWLVLSMSECLARVGLLYCRKVASTWGGRNSLAYCVKTFFSIFNFGWFLHATKLLWMNEGYDDNPLAVSASSFDSPRPTLTPTSIRDYMSFTPGAFLESTTFNTLAVPVATFFWWCQAVRLMMPCAFYGLICCCLPCLLCAADRLPNVEHLRNILGAAAGLPHTQPSPQAPLTDILTNLKVKTYGEHINVLRESNVSMDVDEGNEKFVSNASLESPGSEKLPTGDSQTAISACPICMQEFVLQDEVLVMPCDERHFFHRECVESWFKTRQLCPVCRASIN